MKHEKIEFRNDAEEIELLYRYCFAMTRKGKKRVVEFTWIKSISYFVIIGLVAWLLHPMIAAMILVFVSIFDWVLFGSRKKKVAELARAYSKEMKKMKGAFLWEVFEDSVEISYERAPYLKFAVQDIICLSNFEGRQIIEIKSDYVFPLLVPNALAGEVHFKKAIQIEEAEEG